jgi:hypothetical protein
LKWKQMVRIQGIKHGMEAAALSLKLGEIGLEI